METSQRADMRASHSENKVMSSDQFEQVVKAILEGKYSWACVLILRFAGYNPAHYIPYRTYKRLIKGNRQTQHNDRREQAVQPLNRKATRSLDRSSVTVS
jgi:hypothetical protein